MTNKPEQTAAIVALRQQRSHLLFVSSQPRGGTGPEFLTWYQGRYAHALLNRPEVLNVRHYEQHAFDITRGRYAPLPFRYLGLYDLSLDGAEAAQPVIEAIEELHGEQPAAKPPATWLYYPSSEKVGRSAARQPSMLTLAFANGLPGQEAEFREWYATRHIRHALNIPALVSGQCFERTLFQRPGAADARFATIAMYEQEGPPEDIVKSFASLSPETFHFPMLDKSRFAEWVYRPLSV